MRVGSNPEKKKELKITYKQHRVIIPVYIPDSNEDYFKNLFEVFKRSISSLLSTIDDEETNITIINNNCKKEVTLYIDELLNNNKIDKHIIYQKNYGKVFAILSESKAVYEPLITIADADVFYFSGWENAVINIHNEFNKAGVVSPIPMPHLAFYNNKSLFVKNWFRIYKKKIINDEDLNLFGKSIGNINFFKKNNYYLSQFYLKKNEKKFCIGASHFIATYKTESLYLITNSYPSYVFKNGYENEIIDRPLDKLGYYRFSTLKTFVYHLGNTLPEKIVKTKLIKEKQIKYNYSKKRNFKISFYIISLFFKIIKYLKK